MLTAFRAREIETESVEVGDKAPGGRAHPNATGQPACGVLPIRETSAWLNEKSFGVVTSM